MDKSMSEQLYLTGWKSVYSSFTYVIVGKLLNLTGPSNMRDVKASAAQGNIKSIELALPFFPREWTLEHNCLF